MTGRKSSLRLYQTQRHNKSYWNPERHPSEIHILSERFNLCGLSLDWLLMFAWMAWRMFSLGAFCHCRMRISRHVQKCTEMRPKQILPARHVWEVWCFTADRQWAREANAVNTQFKLINQTQSTRRSRIEKEGCWAAEAEACACKCSF